MNFVTGVYWNRGKGRRLNEDSLALQQVFCRRGRVVMGVVCDGVGSMQEGERASGYVTERLVEWFHGDGLSAVERRAGIGRISRSAVRLLEDAACKMREYGKRREIRMGTTVSALFVWERRYVLIHLGDSRIYRLRRKRLCRLTEDHVGKGGGLTACLGSHYWQKPQVKTGRVRRGDAFLLCTDGFVRRLEERRIGEALGEAVREEQVRRRLGELGRCAMRRGETDNLCAIYMLCEKMGLNG